MAKRYKDVLIDMVPADWEVVRLGDSRVAEIRGSKSVNNVKKIAFITMDFIPDSNIYAKYEIRNLNEVKSSTYCEAGDLLLAKITPSLENGKQGIVPEGIPNGFALATTEVFPIVCKGIDRLFLFYILKHPRFRKVLEYSMRGTTGRQRVPKEAVEKLLIPLPPLPEQRKIAEILSTVDKAIQKVDEAIAKTERLKKGLMQELLTKGIGHTEFKDTEIGRIPKEWEVVRLGDFVKVQGGFAFKSSDYVKAGIALIRISNISHGNIELRELVYLPHEYLEKYKEFSLEAGDIVIVLTRPIIEGGIKAAKVEKKHIPALLNQRVGRFRITNKYHILSNFLFYVIFSNNFINQVKKGLVTMNQPNISPYQIERFKIPLPPLPEQQKIVEILSTVDKKLELERKRKEKLERIKKGLMNDLLTGRRRVRVA